MNGNDHKRAEDSRVTSHIRDDGHIAVPAFNLRASALLEPKSRDAFTRQARQWEAISRGLSAPPPGATMDSIRAEYSRQIQTDLDKQLAGFEGYIRQEMMDSVPVAVFEPAQLERDYQLINIHGGGFSLGRGTGAAIESIPICYSTGARVVSVEYRLAPEHSPRDALADVANVYAHMLRERPASLIGIFGSSAGALLTAQFTSILIGRKQALPGAIAMLGMGANWIGGDSSAIFSAIDRVPDLEQHVPDYIAAAEPDDHDIFPTRDSARLKAFPSALLISSTRDVALSSVVDTHARIVAAGGEAKLHIWEGLRHCFYYDPDFSESREVYRVVGDFFNHTLI